MFLVDEGLQSLGSAASVLVHREVVLLVGKEADIGQVNSLFSVIDILVWIGISEKAVVGLGSFLVIARWYHTFRGHSVAGRLRVPLHVPLHIAAMGSCPDS